mmetsp:Transcript_122442/g.236027  ORF Transcript_122442/g.236027 Transcript_122442/m.236027 type:complete len:575 (-) Transcript_122442:31-1755(-)
MSFCRRGLWTSSLNGLPPTVLLAYFLITWMESFPLTAMNALLVDDLKFGLPTYTTYYAVTFMPFMWKPMFGFISDTFPICGFHRAPYIALSACGSAVSFFGMALLVTSPAAAFAVALCNNTCAAFMQLMIGAFLVDVARMDLKNSAALQASANAAKWAGTLTAQGMALAVYARGAHGGPEASGALLRVRPSIALTGIAPTLLFLLAPFLPEARYKVAVGEQAAVEAAVEAAHLRHQNRRCRLWSCCRRPSTGKMTRFTLVVALVQVFLVVVGCQALMNVTTWWCAVALSAAASLAVGLRAAGCCSCRACCGWLRRPEALQLLTSAEGSSTDLGMWRWARICLFCFVANALPSSSVSVGQLQFAVFTADSFQALSIISSIASLCASLAFGGGFNRRSLAATIAATTFMAAAVGFAPLPFCLEGGPRVKSEKLDLWSTVGILGTGASILGNMATVFTVLPVDTLVTSASGQESSDRSSTALAFFLSSYSLGATVSGLISAPILQAIGLDGQNWHALPAWVATTASLKLLLLAMLPLLPPQPSESREAPLQEEPEFVQEEPELLPATSDPTTQLGTR